MPRFPSLLLVIGLCLAPALAKAQLDMDHPGYFPIEELDIFPEESLNLEINITAPMIRFIALATDEEEPELSRLVEGLKSIRVRGADLDSIDSDSLKAGIRAAADELAAAGWTSMVRMRDEDEEIYIYFKDQDGEMAGLTVLSLEDDDGMLINLVGKIDPTGLGSLAQGLDLPQLEEAVKEVPDVD